MEQAKIHGNLSLFLTTLGFLDLIQFDRKAFLTLQHCNDFLRTYVKQIFAYLH